ncbi:hypothetical protein HTZ77_39930 [Nonomuraea sp. SMC257]|uniref:Uncharacterized protein n=1 Tax=Nonomuraea montanisoli TaxID=2741721 RepID=A0A7Y6IFX8_9ACTN|nr:hypothetical protein [Nonomuraea montanisoli]NUW37528.1 hypothetical protein [Nonomuraea montanisoli]
MLREPQPCATDDSEPTQVMLPQHQVSDPRSQPRQGITLSFWRPSRLNSWQPVRRDFQRPSRLNS